MTTPLKIVHVSSEVSPFSKTGGLGSVANALPRAMKKLGHEISVITPLYEQVIDKEKYKLKKIFNDVDITVDHNHKIKVNFYLGFLKADLPVYFVENEKYFSRRKNLYGSSHENGRFRLFNVAVLKLLSLIEYRPDILQCHDWQSGLIPYFLSKGYYREGVLKKTLCVYTIHNLVFQFGKNWWEIDNGQKDDGRSSLPDFYNERSDYINFAKRALIHADLITTVSEQYKKEIITKDYGEDLHRILQNREDKLFGIVNGIDYEDYNPKTDPGLISNFDIDSIYKKRDNKINIQKIFKLPINQKVPVLVTTSRLVEQKGFDLLKEILEQLLKSEIQLILLGTGDKCYIKHFQKIEKKFPKKLAVIPSHELNQRHETSAMAGGDIFLLPSRFEPCGINQMIGMRYGCVPVVRKIGGLADSVSNFSPKTMKGNGFTFKSYNALDFLVAITRAIETYQYPEVWNKIIHNGMEESFSWEIPAKKYITVFRKFIKKTSNNK